MKRMLDDTGALYDQRRRVKALDEQLLKDLEFHGIVGKSPVVLEVLDFCVAGGAALYQQSADRADQRGQGAGSTGHSPDQPGKPAETGYLQLFRDGGYSVGEPVVRPCARFLYRATD